MMQYTTIGRHDYTNLHSRRKSYHNAAGGIGDDELSLTDTQTMTSNATQLMLTTTTTTTSTTKITSQLSEGNNPISANSMRQSPSGGGGGVVVIVPDDECTTDAENTKLHSSSRTILYHPIHFIQLFKRYFPDYISSKILKIENSEYRLSIYVALSFVGIAILLGCILIQHRHRKVILHIIHDPWHHGKAFVFRVNNHKTSPHGGKFQHHYYTGSPRFVTVVIPSVVNPAKRLRRLEAIHATWGASARAIFVVHSVAEEFPHGKHLTIDTSHHTSTGKVLSMPSDPYCYPQNLLLPATISVDAGLPRLYHTIRTIHEAVNPDFAFFVNDHSFVIPEHLCKYLDGVNADKQDMYGGHALRQDDDNVFNSGAAGYILSRKTMRRLIEKWDAEDPACWISMENTDGTNTNWLQGNPGLVIAKCLGTMNVTAVDTRAERKYHRFHAFPITRLIQGSDGVDDWYVRKHDNLPERYATIFDESYSQLLPGPDCCSEDSISFHYVEASECRAIFNVRKALLGQWKQKGRFGFTSSSTSSNMMMSDVALKELIVKNWPSTQKDIGGYSRPIPKNDDDKGWIDLLATIRKLSYPKNEREC